MNPHKFIYWASIKIKMYVQIHLESALFFFVLFSLISFVLIYYYNLELDTLTLKLLPAFISMILFSPYLFTMTMSCVGLFLVCTLWATLNIMKDFGIY